MILTIRDETASGSVTIELTLDLLNEKITVRELIRSRVYQEVDDFNRLLRQANATATPYNGLVVPTEAESSLNASRPLEPKNVRREIDWKKQFETACEAFSRNGFFILIDDHQVESLDEEVLLKADSKVSFVKLTPLVGG